jgi:hypothetical protein
MINESILQEDVTILNIYASEVPDSTEVNMRRGSGTSVKIS